MSRAERRLSFFVIAPEEQIDAGVFENQMRTESILKTVERRINEYDEPKYKWFDGWFLPTMEHIKIDLISWEKLLEYVATDDAMTGEEFDRFYRFCLQFNGRIQRSKPVSGLPT